MYGMTEGGKCIMSNQLVEARAIVSRAYNGKRNFITPLQLDFGIKGSRAWELSYGDAIFGSAIHGVSVVDIESVTPIRDECMSFETREEAQEYIDKLGE